MKRRLLNYAVDIGMTVSFLSIFVTGVLKYQRLIRFFAESNIYLPTYHITLVHKYSGIAIGVFVAFHFILHFKWIVSVTRSIFQKRRIKG